MKKLDHAAISAILHAEVTGKVKVLHGQMGNIANAQMILDTRRLSEKSANLRKQAISEVATAFRVIRERRGDYGSTDLYVADPLRNALFQEQCRLAGITASAAEVNKMLFHARKIGLLKSLRSKRTSIAYDDFAFACEFAATKLKYETGAAVDDIICDPALAERFDAIACSVAPGHSSFEYRWAMLSIRKKPKSRAQVTLPEFSGQFRLAIDGPEMLPEEHGVYLLRDGEKPLYVHAVANLRRGIQAHTEPPMLAAVTSRSPLSAPALISASYSVVSEHRDLIEYRIVNELRPLYNVKRIAA